MLIDHTLTVPNPEGGYDVPFEAVRATLDAQKFAGGTRRAQVVLMPHDTAWSSASTKHRLHGPATVTYLEYVDGAIDTIIR